MRKSLFFKQKRPLTVVILAIVFLIITCISLIEDSNELYVCITLFSIGIVLLAYSVSFELREDFDHKKHFKIFGITFFKLNLKFFNPEYTVVFSTSTSKSSEWGPVAAMGTQIEKVLLS